MRNTNRIARHYDLLTPEERFRLLVAAGARGDKAEQDRLVRASQRIALSAQDHAPYAHAFEGLALLVFLDLLEEAAQYIDLLALAGVDRDSLSAEDEAEDESQAEEEKANSVVAEASEETADANSAEHEEDDWFLYERYLDLALASGFLLRTKVEGWKLFCTRLTIEPFVFWAVLPGFDRLQRALHFSEKAAFVPEGFLRWLNGTRPAGEPERLQVPLTVKGLAAELEEVFWEQVDWWGG